FSPDGRHLCVAGGRYEGRLYEVASGKLRWHDQMRTATFSPDGKTIVTTDLLPRVSVLDVATGEQRSESWPGRTAGRKEAPGSLRSLVVAPDGQRLALAFGDGHVSFADARTGAEVRRFQAVDFPPDGRARFGLGPGYEVEALAFTADGRLLLSGG